MYIMQKELAVYIFANLFRIYVVYRFMGIFFEKNPKRNRLEFALFTLYYGINSVGHILWGRPYINLLTNTVFLILITMIYRSKISTKIIAVVMIYAVQILSDGIVYNFIHFYKESSVIMNTGVISNLLVLFMELLIESAVDYKRESKINPMHLTAIVIIPTGSIIIAFFIILSEMTHIQKSLCIGILLIINAMIFDIYDVLIEQYIAIYEKKLLEQQNKSYRNQFEIIKESNDNMRLLKHDIKNHMYILEDMIRRDEKEKILEYINDVENILDVKRQYSNSGNIDIDSIINYKLSAAEAMGAKLKLEIRVPARLDIKEFDINVILSNVLDNAVEAIKFVDNKLIDIKIEFSKGVLYLCVKNTYLKIELDEKGELKTTKQDFQNHGLGLNSVRRTAEKYNGTMITELEENMFTIKVLLYSNTNYDV